MRRRLPLLSAVVLAALALAGGRADAHVEPDVSTVPAGGEATISFVAEHGCDDSPTVRVDIQLPDGVTDAAPGAKEGWLTEVADGVVVFEWEGFGGDDSGAFEVSFTAPDTPGETLLFPTIQTCTEGSIDWIQEDPDGERPAPRVQVAEGEATTTTTTAAPDEPAEETTTTVAADNEPTTTAVDEAAADDDGDDDGGARPFVIAAVVLVIGAGGVFAAAKLRQRQEP